MGNIYLNQSSLLIKVFTGIDLNACSVALIKYEKPGGTTGSWTGTVTDADKGIFEYSVPITSPFDELGEWKAWAHITFTNGKIAQGEVFHFIVYEEGE